MPVQYRVQLEGVTMYVSDEDIQQGLGSTPEANKALMDCYNALMTMIKEEKETTGQDIGALGGFFDGLRVQIELLETGYVRNSK